MHYVLEGLMMHAVDCVIKQSLYSQVINMSSLCDSIHSFVYYADKPQPD